MLRLPGRTSMKVLGRDTSINVRKVLWTLDELGLAYDHEGQWGTPEAPTRSDAFLALNPNGLIPVLIDGASVWWESNAICRYLAGRAGRDDLLPLGPRARAPVEMWMDWQATSLNNIPAFLALVRGDTRFSAGEIADSAGRWTEVMKVLDDHLAGSGEYAAGAAFTLADIVLCLAAHRYFSTPIAHGDFKAMRRWMERLSTRPAYAAWCSPRTP